MWLTISLGIVAGLSLLLYGIQMMAAGLQKTAGNRLRLFVEFLTKNRFIGLLVGMVVTMIIHSSSATSVMVVGFVNSGIMTLQQAVGVIMGANIGTTVTGQLLSFDIVKYAPLALGGGLILQSLSKTTRKRNFAEILIGFGILFVGMGLLKSSMNPLKEFPQFEEMLIKWGSNPLLGVLLGFIITLIMQSSAATIGLLIALGSEGLIPITAALYIVYGDNIGTCTTALISSIGSSRNARRVALIHLMFNIIGTLIFVLFLGKPLYSIVTYFNPTDVARQIANAHSLFNIVNVILLFPAAGLLVKLSRIIIPDKVEEGTFIHLDPRILATPAIALKNTLAETRNMANLAKESLKFAILAYREKNEEHMRKSLNMEQDINTYQRSIMAYLQKLSKTNLSNHDRRVVDALFNTVNDIERIGDHAENIAELSQSYMADNVEFDPEALSELREVIDHVLMTFRTTIEAMTTGDKEKAKQVIVYEEQMDELEELYRQNHISRMHKKEASIESGVIFLDFVSNLERISDHCMNVADTILALEEDKTKGLFLTEEEFNLEDEE